MRELRCVCVLMIVSCFCFWKQNEGGKKYLVIKYLLCNFSEISFVR